MKKTLLYTLAGAFALAGLVETAPVRASEAAASAPRSLEEMRAEIRGEAMTSLARGAVVDVAMRRVNRRQYRRPGVFRSRTLSRVHRRGRSCGKYTGRRCYYTPRLLKPFRQG